MARVKMAATVPTGKSNDATPLLTTVSLKKRPARSVSMATIAAKSIGIYTAVRASGQPYAIAG
jgi:hypothetical protein